MQAYRQYFVALILAATTAPAFSAEKSVWGGAGLNISKTDQEVEFDGFETKNRIGFNVGAGVDVFFNETFGFGPGINIETRGIKVEGSFDDPPFGTYSEKFSANFLYLQIPFLAKVQFPAGPARIQVLAGPEIGIPLSKKVEVEITSEGETTKDEGDAELKALDFGLTFGGAVKFPVGAVGIFIEPSYYLGLTNFDDSEVDPEFEEEAEEVKHRNFKVKLGIYKDL